MVTQTEVDADRSLPWAGCHLDCSFGGKVVSCEGFFVGKYLIRAVDSRQICLKHYVRIAIKYSK